MDFLFILFIYFFGGEMGDSECLITGKTNQKKKSTERISSMKLPQKNDQVASVKLRDVEH